jgi:DNA primase
MRNKILSLLEPIFGGGTHTTKDNFSFFCPVCNHRKKKLEVDALRGYWHCWVCNKGGKNFFSLLKWGKATQTQYDQLNKILGTSRRKYSSTEDYNTVLCELPKEFIPLWKPNPKNFYWRACKNYLKSRGVTDGDILKYGIGYCIEGKYQEMVIIPSYDVGGKLNYFTARAFMSSSRETFKNPPMKKNVVGFEMMINWDEPIIIVESALDAIAIRRNAIPLFGKTISIELRKNIIRRDIKTVIICLDADAIADAINHVQFFLNNGVDVYVVELEGDDDASSLGYKNVWKKLDGATRFDENILFERRIKDHLDGTKKTNLPHRRYSLQTRSAAQRVSGSVRPTIH